MKNVGGGGCNVLGISEKHRDQLKGFPVTKSEKNEQ